MRRLTSLLVMTFTTSLLLACATSGRTTGSGGAGGDEESWSNAATGTGAGGGGSGTLTWAQHCQQRGDALMACGSSFDVADCTQEGTCFEPIMRADAVQPYLQCRVQKDCMPHNCFVEAAATFTLTNTQNAYADACNQRASCDGVVDWDWCNDDFAWKLLSDTFLQDLAPCFDIASCVDADACLSDKVDAAFAACP